MDAGQPTQAPRKGRSPLLWIALLAGILVLYAAIGAPYNRPQASGGSGGDESSYLGLASRWANTYADSLDEMVPLFEDPQFGSRTWERKVAQALDKMGVTNDAVLAYEAPAKHRRSHGKLQEAARHFDRFITHVTAGIQDRDTSLLLKANRDLTNANVAVNEATDLLNTSR